MKTIKLYNSEQVARVDDEDVSSLAGYSWRLSANGYAVRGGGISMHRSILGLFPADKRQTHHIDGNKLNNQKLNLAIVTQSQNGQARKLQRNNTSGFRGVTYQQGSWKAQIYHKRKRLCLGCYPTKEAAAEAYNRKAVELFGEHTVINKI